MRYGAGISSCGQWSASRKSLSYGDWGLPAQWILGYVTAVNSYAGTPTRETDAEGIMAWTDTYCQTHPLESIGTAASALVVDLGAAH